MPNLYRSLYRIRRFEETVLENFPKGVFYGTTHTYIGEEANAVGVLSRIGEGDIVFSNHRCHGHFLAYGGEVRALFAELMGKSTGVCGGRGGSQHLQWRNFYSNGVLGGTVPIATGMALAEKYLGRKTVTVCFLGDGAMGEGVIYEAFNMAALWDAPILYVIENNRIAQTTPIEMAVAGEIGARLAAFGIPVQELDSSDVLEIVSISEELIGQVREYNEPRALLIRTYRFGPHSKGDDTRDPAEVARYREVRDPISIHRSRLDKQEAVDVENQIEREIRRGFQQAKVDPLPEPGDHGLIPDYTFTDV